MSIKDATKALSMIRRAKEQGRASAVSITRQGVPGTYNPDTGQVEGGSAPAVYSGIGVKDKYTQFNTDGTLIKSGDQILYVPALGFVRPLTGEAIVVGSNTHTIQSVDVIAPGDVDVLFILQIRGL